MLMQMPAHSMLRNMVLAIAAQRGRQRMHSEQRSCKHWWLAQNLVNAATLCMHKTNPEPWAIKIVSVEIPLGRVIAFALFVMLRWHQVLPACRLQVHNVDFPLGIVQAAALMTCLCQSLHRRRQTAIWSSAASREALMCEWHPSVDESLAEKRDSLGQTNIVVITPLSPKATHR